MTISQQERLEILQDVSKSWLELLRALRGLSDTQMTQPGVVEQWSVKDLMAHISSWERELIGVLDRLEHGEEPGDSDWAGIDAFNAEQTQLSAQRSLDDIRDDFEETHADLMAMLEVTPVLTRELVKGDTYEHYAEHAAQIRQWRDRH